MKNFVTSDYLEIIKLLGYNIKPMSYSEILNKTNIPNTSLSRALNWLQNIEGKETGGKELKEAYFLKRDKYIEHNGLTKSKSSSFKLTENGIELFNNEFLKEYETNYLEDVIKDFKINQIIWDFISRNKKLFFKDYFRDSNISLEPWTLHLFEFFDDLDETELIQIQESVSGPPNMRVSNLLKILSEILIQHPVWEEKIISKGFERTSLNTGVLDTIKKDSLLKDKFFIIERGEDVVCLFKSDKLIKAIYTLIQKYLKIYYWQENNLYLPKESIIQNIIDDVINELYQNYKDYEIFIDKFRLEIFYLVKQILIEDFISGINPIKMPFNLMNNELREMIDFQLKRKLLSSDSEDIPPILLNQGASKDLIKEKINLLVKKYFQDKNNLINNLNLLEILVYNYSMELRSDFWFYERWKMSLQPFTQRLIDECLLWNNEYTEQVLVLGFIFYNQKFPDYRKAIDINEKLLQLYPTNDYLLENLLYLHFSSKEWNLEKISILINKTIEIYPENIVYCYSNIIINLLNDRIKNIKEIVSLINNLYNSIEDLSNFIKIIKFFSDKLESHGFNDINLKLLKAVNTLFSDIKLKFYYAKALERNRRIIKALKIYLNILDFFPNMFLESYVLLIFLNNYNRFTEKEKKTVEIEFLKKVQEFSVILMSSVEFDVNESDIYEFEEKRAIFLKDLRTQLKSINLLIKNSVCKILPLKIKAILLKALNREKNLESTLLKILDTSPKNIWVINELGFLYFQQGKFEEGIKLFELAELIKHEIHYNIPYLHIIGHS
ncbi:MAG: tetratricopeptide repeat protein, partial [Candidatus Thorarchaeota archaeon]